MVTSTATRAPRSLADELRARDDARLVALVVARPDLLIPQPGDLSELAGRAGSRPSVARALDRLTAFEIQVLDALVVLPEPASREAIADLLTGRRPDDLRERVTTTIERLRELALVWGDGGTLRVVGAVRQLVGANPVGLGPPLDVALGATSPARLQDLLADLGLPGTHDPVSAVQAVRALVSDRDRLAGLLDGAPAEASEILDRLMWGPPFGTLGAGSGSDGTVRAPRAAEARTPVEWLLAHGLLAPWGNGTVVLPREVGLHLRCHRDGRGLHRDLAPKPPEPQVTPHDADRVDGDAAGNAIALVHAVETVAREWGTAGPAVLRTGGIGVRDLRRVAQVLDLPEPETAFVLELAYVAGLIAPSQGVDEVWLPTLAYDRWLARPEARRWTALVAAWLTTTRVSGLVGERDDKGRPIVALGPGLDRPVVREIKYAVLGELDGLPAGASIDAEDLLARLAWSRPRRGGAMRERLIAWTVREAGWLGVTGMAASGSGALSRFGRAALDSGIWDADEAEETPAADALAAALPRPVDRVMLQADLTAVAPGPLTRPLADVLAVLADVESKGAATVYRFTPGSVRRALDAGHEPADLHEFLAEHSATPVPQPLRYLIDDAARRHGNVRVGAAGAYVRCDDALAAELLADRGLESLGLRRLAPGVLVSGSPVNVLLERLREAGYAPAAESMEGAVVASTPEHRRAGTSARPEPVLLDPPLPPAEGLAAVVRALRSADTLTPLTDAEVASMEAAAPKVPHIGPTEVLVELLQAAAEERSVWLGVVDAEGAESRCLVDPVRVGQGQVTAYDRLRGAMRTFQLPRVYGLRRE